MNENFITEIKLNNKEILNNLYIPLSKDRMKHLIITGKNGSGKTTLLKYIKDYLREKLNVVDEDSSKFASERDVHELFKELTDNDTAMDNEEINQVIVNIRNSRSAKEAYGKGDFVVCYLDSMRGLEMDAADGAEEVILEDKYNFKDKPYRLLIKYMIHLKTIQSFAKNENDIECDKVVSEWFNRFENVLKKLWDCNSFKLKYEYRRYDFSIYEDNKKPYNFFQLSDGYLSVLRMFADIMMRMERNWLSKGNYISTYDMKGIVLIDEIETHLHIALQKSILPCLIEIFPNIQFIISTHSPFILNSVSNAIIYDLENNTLVDSETGLSNIPYEGVVEGYFGASQLSDELRNKFERYTVLYSKKELTDDDIYEIIHLEGYLDKIPDFLALDIMADYKRMKLELMDRIE